MTAQLALLTAPHMLAADRAAGRREALVRSHLDGVHPGILPATHCTVEPAPDLPGFVLVTWPAACEARVYRVDGDTVRPWSGRWTGATPEAAARAAVQFTHDRLEA